MLGTAQLGLNYGIANNSGRPDYDVACDILKRAWRGGIRIVDTAQVYGDSEDVISRFLKGHPESPFDVITKLDPKIKASDVETLEAAVKIRREKIGQPLSGIMFHDNTALATLNNEVRHMMHRCIESGATAAFGISIYTPEDFLAALNEDVIKIIQAPFNVLDGRLIKEGLLERAHNLGKRIYIRSVYLQGLLLMHPNDLPSSMAFATKTIQRWRELCKEFALSPMQAALGYVRDVAPDTLIVIGCETVSQINENLDAFNMPGPSADFFTAVEKFRVDDPRIIEPSTWG